MSATEMPRDGVLADGVHRFPVRVYYEDTDAAGIVYYANYLKFAERARTEMMRLFGVAHEEVRRTEGSVFIVRRAGIEFLAPARLDDELVVETRVKEVGGASITLDQDIYRDTSALVRCAILLACIGRHGRPTRIPSALRAALDPRHQNRRMVPAHAR